MLSWIFSQDIEAISWVVNQFFSFNISLITFLLRIDFFFKIWFLVSAAFEAISNAKSCCFLAADKANCTFHNSVKPVIFPIALPNEIIPGIDMLIADIIWRSFSPADKLTSLNISSILPREESVIETLPRPLAKLTTCWTFAFKSIWFKYCFQACCPAFRESFKFFCSCFIPFKDSLAVFNAAAFSLITSP